VLWKSAFIAVEVVMGVGYSGNERAFHQRMNMFCKNKKNKNAQKEKRVYQASPPKSKFESDYVEIEKLASDFSEISKFAYDINAIAQEEGTPNAAMFFYQKSLRKAFVDEFEERLRTLLGRRISFEYYWKTRSC